MLITLHTAETMDFDLSSSHDASASVIGDSLTNPNLQYTIVQLDHLRVSIRPQNGTRRKQQRLTHTQLDNLGKQPPRMVCSRVLLLRHTRQMLLQRPKPLGRGEAVDDGDRAQVQQLGRDGGLLGGDDDARGEMALETDRGEEVLGQSGGLAALVHVLVRLVECDDAANDVSVLLEEEGEADVEELAGALGGDAGAGEVDDGELAGARGPVVAGLALLGHEGLEIVEALVEGHSLVIGQVFLVEHLAESSVVELGARGLLLLDAQLSEDAVDDVHVQRRRTTDLDTHEIHHALGVQILLTNSQRLDIDVHARVRPGHRANIGGGAQDAYLDVAIGREVSGFAGRADVIRAEGVVVEDDTSQRTRQLVCLGLEQAVLEKAG